MFKITQYIILLGVSCALLVACSTQTQKTGETLSTGEEFPQEEIIMEEDKNSEKENSQIFGSIPTKYFGDSIFNYCLKEKIDICIFDTAIKLGETPQCDMYVLDSSKKSCEAGKFLSEIDASEGKSKAFSFSEVFNDNKYFKNRAFPKCFMEKTNICISESNYRAGNNPKCSELVGTDFQQKCEKDLKEGKLDDISVCDSAECKFKIIMRQAYNKLDESLCKQLEDFDADECHNNILFQKAVDEKNSVYCDKMVDSQKHLSYTKVFCKSEVLFIGGQ